MAIFAIPYVDPNLDSWGPPAANNAAPTNSNSSSTDSRFADLPYAPFGRSDRLGRAADFASGRGGQGGYNNRGYGGGKYGRDGRYNNNNDGGGDGDDNEAEESFQLVDTSKTGATKRFVTPAARRRQHSSRLRQVNARRQQTTQQSLSKETLQNRNKGGPGGRGGAAGGRGGGRFGGRGGRGYQRNNRVDRQPSVAVQNDWKKVDDIDLAKLAKHLVASTTVPDAQDVLWCGFLDQYNDSYDKVTARQAQPLKRMEHKEFYPVTTTDDPVLEKLAIDGVGQVFITDAILAHLMTCTRSVYPWDLVVQKLPNNVLFIDKRDNSQLDYLTVYETSYSPPTAEEGVNTPERLGLEATMINQNFSQQILKKAGRKEMDMPNPFYDEEDADEGMEPSSVAFRYRKFALDDKTTLVCRTELHGLVKKTQYMTAFALNEYIPPTSTNQSTVVAPNWRDKIDSQRGAVLANELKNNSFKLAKWTAQSLLAGADQMKIGFCSRVAPKSPYEHVILATQFYRPKDFATQITLQEGQMWAMIRMFVQLLQKQECGKYVLMREPNAAKLSLYKVPPETFEDE
jgi:translation initiation factor 3 subunit D